MMAAARRPKLTRDKENQTTRQYLPHDLSVVTGPLAHGFKNQATQAAPQEVLSLPQDRNTGYVYPFQHHQEMNLAGLAYPPQQLGQHAAVRQPAESISWLPESPMSQPLVAEHRSVTYTNVNRTYLDHEAADFTLQDLTEAVQMPLIPAELESLAALVDYTVNPTAQGEEHVANVPETPNTWVDLDFEAVLEDVQIQGPETTTGGEAADEQSSYPPVVEPHALDLDPSQYPNVEALPVDEFIDPALLQYVG